jgi:drug/metabolite transporter (DMT)-like permease
MSSEFHRDLGAGEREHYRALLFIMLCVLFWGISFISTKVVLRQIPPATIVLYRQIIACLALMPLLPFWRSPSLPRREDAGRIAASAFFGIVMYFVLENKGLEHTTASNASLIVSALPIFTLFSEALLYHKKIGRQMMTYLLISILGVYLVVSINGRLDLSSSQLFGNILVLGAIACWVAYTLLNRGAAQGNSSLNIIFYQSLAAIFLCMPFAVVEKDRWIFPLELSSSTWLNVIFLGTFCSAWAYVFYIRALVRLGPTLSAAFLNLIPVVTAVCGYLMLQERLTWIQVLGMILIMLALYKLNSISSSGT